jgi:hypothetical protein
MRYIIIALEYHLPIHSELKLSSSPVYFLRLMLKKLVTSFQTSVNEILNLRMHLFVNNMADPDISDYEFDADDLFRR